MLHAMNHDTALFDATLACPRCDQPLQATGTHYHSAAGDVDYPIVGGMPWLFAEPQLAIAEWRHRFRYADAVLAGEIDQLEKALASTATGALTQQRLTALLAGKNTQRNTVSELLTPLDTRSEASERASYLGLRTRLPPDQGLNTYTPNIVRDWAPWGEDENAASLALVREALADAKPDRILVLGAGAGRLAHDLNVALAPSLCVGLDFNPLLMLLAARLSQGASQTFVEFPLAPKTLTDHAVTHTLSAPSLPATPTHWVIGDALRPPFVEASFDLVVTPWLVDIIAEPPAGFAPRINRLLSANGTWLNFGSVAFRDPDPSAQIGIEELGEQIAAAGFAAKSSLERDLPVSRLAAQPSWPCRADCGDAV